MSKWFSAFAAPEAKPVPAPPKTPPATPKPVLAPSRPVSKASGSLCERVGEALEPYRKDEGTAGLARRLGVNPGTVIRITSGVGLNVGTLEQVCEKMGWTLTITDHEGRVI